MYFLIDMLYLFFNNLLTLESVVSMGIYVFSQLHSAGIYIYIYKLNQNLKFTICR